MIMGKFVTKRKHTLFEWLTAIMLGAGCVVFMFFSKKDKGKYGNYLTPKNAINSL